MTKQTIIIALGAVLILAGLFWWGKANQAAPVPKESGASGSLTLPESFYDFGSISMANGNVEKTFSVQNTSASDVLIETIVTSCMCTEAFLETPSGEKGPFGMPGHGIGALTKAGETIPAGESRTIRVVFDPNAHGPAGIGLAERIVEITDRNGTATRLKIKAVVTP